MSQLIGKALIGKAREIYTQLGVEQSHHYETVKELILKGYELVPEAYRQKFRNCKKDSNQTHVEFAKLTVNLAKTEFCHATVIFLGHLVGQGQVKPLEAKVNAISEFPVPKCKRQLMRFLGMAGYYRKFCKNFSGIAEPLTNLLKKSTKFKWNDKCQNAFDRLKAILKSAPVLLAPDFDRCFERR